MRRAHLLDPVRAGVGAAPGPGAGGAGAPPTQCVADARLRLSSNPATRFLDRTSQEREGGGNLAGRGEGATHTWVRGRPRAAAAGACDASVSGRAESALAAVCGESARSLNACTSRRGDILHDPVTGVSHLSFRCFRWVYCSATRLINFPTRLRARP
ncbi:hypothetical protein OBBRIDRAFT_794056, partial [Obba rivulosa]